MKLKAIKWIADHNGEIIKRTLIGAGSIVGLALLSGLTVNPADDFSEFEGEADEIDNADDVTIEVEDDLETPDIIEPKAN